jgi:5-methylcytosine-specific restriction enzyme subunit McrC
MTATITLGEYESVSVELPEQVASALALATKDRLRVAVDGTPGRYHVEATQYVGSVVMPGVSVLIRPKVPLENVFLLLEAVAEPEWRSDEFTWDAASGLLPAFAAFYARTLEHIAARGLFRAYRTEEEWIPSLRGRLDLTAQFRRPGIAIPVPCRYDEFTADVVENQVLKAALMRLTRLSGVPAEVHRRLRRLRSFFDEVSDIKPDPIVVDRLHIHRLNQRYVPALRLAQLVLRDLTLADQRGERAAASFLINMNDLFQDFVTLRLRRLLRRRLDVEAEPDVYLGHGRKVRMAPDLVFSRHGEAVFVGDTKYKLLGDQLGRGGDYYQMLAYTTALDLPGGVLIYCSTEGAIPDRVIEVVYAGKQLWTYPLDLGGLPAAVDQNLTALAQWIEARARRIFGPLKATA